MKVVNLENWIAEKKTVYNNTLPSRRPKKGSRPLSSRSAEESKRISYACNAAVKGALKSGFLVNVPGGYKICPEKSR